MRIHPITSPPLDIHELSRARAADFMAFFDGEAFSDNPRWSSCYCQCFYEDHAKVDWPSRSAADNRACATQRIAQGRMQGLLAYREGKVVGWCNAAPRPLLHALDTEPIANPGQVGTILCFLVAPSARGRGVATALLDAACEQLRSQGLTFVQANPRPAARSTAENHFGPLSMYLAAGFTVQRTDESDASVWVGKELVPAPKPGARPAHLPTQDEEIARHLREALASGELAAAKGFGQPLPPDEGWNATPEALRMPFKILKDAGYVPAEVELFHERAALSASLERCDSDMERHELLRKLSELEQRIALRLEALRVNGTL
jgi:GNAT superfamily N-acetyltransferase